MVCQFRLHSNANQVVKDKWFSPTICKIVILQQEGRLMVLEPLFDLFYSILIPSWLNVQ